MKHICRNFWDEKGNRIEREEVLELATGEACPYCQVVAG
jgi:hypothetical protein